MPVSGHDLDIQRHMPRSFFVFNDSRLDVVVSYVDIAGIVHFQCLNFISITNYSE